MTGIFSAENPRIGLYFWGSCHFSICYFKGIGPQYWWMGDYLGWWDVMKTHWGLVELYWIRASGCSICVSAIAVNGTEYVGNHKAHQRRIDGRFQACFIVYLLHGFLSLYGYLPCTQVALFPHPASYMVPDNSKIDCWTQRLDLGLSLADYVPKWCPPQITMPF